MTGRLSAIILLALALGVLTGCSISSSLVPAMAEEDGRFGVDTEVRQPFYAEHDGIHRLTIRFYPEGFPGSQVPIDPSQGASIELNYSPVDDRRFPEPSFHQWPEHHEWLPELTGEEQYEQEFCSPYPDLAGIEVRVATFAADVSPGRGTLRPVETVEVLELPVVGQHVGFVPGGSEVEVAGASEGWARVILGDDQRGWIDMRLFDELPEPHRVNDRDVILELFERDGEEPIRTSVINASDMFDISHVQFEFPHLEDSLDQCYRFRLTSPDSQPGNAITIRFDGRGPYDDGNAVLNGAVSDGDIVFQPLYDLQNPLYAGFLDDYEWAAPLDAFEARFDPIDNTADRFLEVRVVTENASMNVPWSRNRPPGQRPLEVAGNPQAPGGGLIFNAAFHHDVPVGEVVRTSGRDLFSRVRIDPIFFAILTIAVFGTVLIGALGWRRSDTGGR